MLLADRDGTILTTLPYGDGVYRNPYLYPAPSPDGQIVAHDATSVSADLTEFTNGVGVRNRDGSYVSLLPGVTTPAFFPDGTILVAGAATRGDRRGLSGLHTSAPPYSSTTPLNAPGLDQAIQPAASPDGTRIAYTIAGGVWVANRDGSGARRLGGDDAAYAWPTFSPDSKGLAVQRSTSSLYNETVIVPLDGRGSAVLVKNTKGEALSSRGRISWVP